MSECTHPALLLGADGQLHCLACGQTVPETPPKKAEGKEKKVTVQS